MFFKYSEYRKYLTYLQTHGPILPIKDWDGSNAILLRHDVDLDVDAAYRLAKIEYQCGIRSSYYFLANCHSYNPFSLINRNKIKEIIQLGFEVGLHFDPTIYDSGENTVLQQFVDEEARMLSTISGQPVKSISLHNPSIHGQYPMFDGYRNAYDARIFSDSNYLSDSCMNFRNKDPYKFVEQIKNSPIQILLHPLHFTENGAAYPEIFSEFLRQTAAELDELYSDNPAYCDQMQGRSLISILKNS